MLSYEELVTLCSLVTLTREELDSRDIEDDWIVERKIELQHIETKLIKMIASII